jgi:hypothetical protein
MRQSGQSVSVSSWEEAREFVEPVVRDIDEPNSELLRVEVVIHGDGQEGVSASYSYSGQTTARNAALLRHAAALLLTSAERIENRPGSA